MNVRRAILLPVVIAALAPLAFAAPPSGASSAKSLESQRNRGLLIARVIPGGPAQRAGIVRGDILIELGGQRVTSPDTVRRVLASHNADDAIVAVIIHGSRTEHMPITLGPHNYHPVLGVDFSRSGVDSKGAPQEEPGAYVDSIVAGGPAAHAGIRRGDIILSVDGTPVDSNHPLIRIIHGYSPGDQLSVRVRQPNGRRFTLSVHLGRSSSGGPLLGLRYSAVPARSAQSARSAQPGISRFFRRLSPPKWFRYFGETLFPNRLKGGSGSGGSGSEGSRRRTPASGGA